MSCWCATFIARHDYQTLRDTLAYIQRLGINCIELMPVGEFEGNESWGYNPSFFFAPDKYYGPKEELKKFVDEAHRRGIAVVMDMVLNHSLWSEPDGADVLRCRHRQAHRQLALVQPGCYPPL